MDKEIWKDIYAEYQVSNLGRVYSKKTKKLLNPSFDSWGYLQVCLYIDGKQKSKKLHRLVAEAFIPNPENKKTVNHEDGNKKNCCVSNLCWATDSEQQIHAYKIGLHKRSNKRVNQYDLKGNFIRTWDSILIAKNELNIGNHISECCKGKRKTAGGFIWKYKDIA